MHGPIYVINFARAYIRKNARLPIQILYTDLYADFCADLRWLYTDFFGKSVRLGDPIRIFGSEKGPGAIGIIKND